MPGPFYMAYIDAPEPFDPDVHNVEDEAIILATVKQDEGEFAALEIDVINPGEGLLAPGRKQWCWFSWDNGIAIVPLFTGRMVGSPEQVSGETMRLLFRAKPLDYDTLKADFAATLKTWPYYDEVWITADEDDPATIIKAYGAVYHVDRVTHAITISDELVGDDTIVLGEDDHFYDSLAVSQAQKPKKKWVFQGQITWTQGGEGTIDLTSAICSKFKQHKSIYNTSAPSGIISTLTAAGLRDAWPTGGTSLGGGWTVNTDTYCRDAKPKLYAPYTVTVTFSGLAPGIDPPTSEATTFLDGYTDWTVIFPIGILEQHTLFDWRAERKRTEKLEFTMVADIQPLAEDEGEEDTVTTVTITAADTVTEPDDLGVMPIGNIRRAFYLPTDRGAYSVQYPMLLGRADLRRSARAIEIGVRVPFATAVNVTLRKNLLVTDHRLPTGTGDAAGKIVSYSIQASGTGENYGDVKIGCAIGRGGTVVAIDGTPTYVETGYVDDAYQELVNAQLTAPTEDIVYDTLTDHETTSGSGDDGAVDLLTLDETTAVLSLELTGGLGDQVTVVTQAPQPIDALKFYPSRLCLQLVDVTGTFETTYTPTVEPLPIPKLIDLEAT